MTLSYRHTTLACYTGYITQAIINNLAPLLFVIFQDSFGLSFEQVGRLVLLNFGVQLVADVFSARYVDRIGYRAAAVLAHVLCTAGLVLLSVLPRVLPSPYLGLQIAAVVYAFGGGLLEVIVSPIVNALPGEAKERAMSLLHSFYCWGQVAVVLLTTLLIRFCGASFWPALPFLWCIIPLCNLFFFLRVPLVPPEAEEKLMSLSELFRSPLFLIGLILMMCAGAAELTMSQWSSLFAERGLQVPKILGDLLGPCLFAILMGIGRAFYGICGEKLNLSHALTLCGGLCVVCYLVTVFSPWPLLSLLGCAICGLSVSLMWPGTFSLMAAAFPRGGTVLFAMLAVFGDLGGSLGPWLAGTVSDFAQHTGTLLQLNATTGEELSQLGLKCGLLAAVLFPVILFAGTILFRRLTHSRT